MEDLSLFRSAPEPHSPSLPANPPFEPAMAAPVPASQHEPRTPRSTPLLQLKLRASCDACGEAKIKCDRARPACGRCVAQGASCVYGVSRKAGKPPRRRPAAATHLPPGPPPARPAESAASMDLTGSGFEDIDILLTPAEASMSIDSPFSTSYAAFQSWFPSDSVLGGIGGLAADPDVCMSAGGQPDDALPKQAAAAPSPPVATSAPGRQDCTQESKDIMRRLYCANPAQPVSDGVAARTLDLGSVLTRNRDVVHRLSLLLGCPCARSPHMAMLYASIISRVLLWYKQAAWNPGPSGAASPSNFPPTPPSLVSHETTPPMSSGTALEHCELPGVDDSNRLSVLPTPVTVGAFQSDDRGLQTALTNRLVLSELKKVRALIESFIGLGAGTCELLQARGDVTACSAAAGSNAAVADATLFTSLGAWLRSEHGRVEWKARSGLSLIDDTGVY